MNGLLIFIAGLLFFSLLKDRKVKQAVPLKKKKETNKTSGFSLTEMAVSISVIAMIMAGVLEGRNLIEDAKERSIINETSKYKVAVSSFYAKYDKYPGDFDEAVAFWGAGTNSNGDNNGKMEFKNGSAVYEGYRAWQHLSYAKMIDAVFVGTQTTSAATLDSDVPKSRSGGGYFFDYSVFNMTEFNALVLGKPVATSATPILVQGIFTPSEGFNIDAKADDGVPTTGSIRGQDGNGSTAGTCVNDLTSNGATSDDIYKISVSGKDCTLAFKILVQ